jgi:membrane protease YdiL (CAAX protease family)
MANARTANAERCPHCGTAWTRTTRFCPSCGASRERTTERRRDRSATRRALAALALAFVGALGALVLGGVVDSEGTAAFQGALATGVSLVLLALACSLLTENDGPQRAFPWRLDGRAALAAIGLGVLSALAAFGYVALLQALQGSDTEAAVEGPDFPVRIQAWLAFAAIAPLSEEALCRGAAWRALERLVPGRPLETMLASAGLFALLHGLNGGFVLEFPHRFVGGLLFGWLRLRTHSLTACVLAHGVHNALALGLE